MLFQHFDWDLTHQVLFLFIYFAQPSYELERPALENALTLVLRTDIFSRKFSVKVCLLLDNLFLVLFLCKLNHISHCFIQISTKSLAKLLIPLRGNTVFFLKSSPGCGPLGKFEHNIKISIKTARVSRLSVSCDYVYCKVKASQTLHGETTQVASSKNSIKAIYSSDQKNISCLSYLLDSKKVT